MLIELISEYGLFLLKVITIVVSLIILIGVILNSKKTTVEGNLIVKNLNNGDGTLSLMLNDDELYKNVNGLVLDARLLLEDVKEKPTNYLRAWFEAKKK